RSSGIRGSQARTPRPSGRRPARRTVSRLRIGGAGDLPILNVLPGTTSGDSGLGEPHHEARSGVSWEVGGAGAAAVEFGDEANDVQAEPEVRPAVAVGTGLPQALEQPPANPRRQRRPGILYREHHESRLGTQ